MFQMSGVGPMFGQAAWFRNSAPEVVPFGIERFETEARRLTAVLEARLQAGPWLAGSQYSIADIMNFGWLRMADDADVRLSEFPAVQRGLAACA